MPRCPMFDNTACGQLALVATAILAGLAVGLLVVVGLVALYRRWFRPWPPD